MNDQADRHENIRRLGEIIQGIPFAMLTTVEEDGRLRSRPMAALEYDFNGNLWFFTEAHSAKIPEIEHDRNVNVSYANADQMQFVSVTGKARIVRDRQKMEQLWTPALQTWFPQGLADPDLGLLKVGIEQAESWKGSESTVVYLFGLTKRVVLDQPQPPAKMEKPDQEEKG
jgi:general stress protein 26